MINLFGRHVVGSFIALNFERNPEYKDIFNKNNTQNGIEQIALIVSKKVMP